MPSLNTICTITQEALRAWVYVHPTSLESSLFTETVVGVVIFWSSSVTFINLIEITKLIHHNFLDNGIIECDSV